jgi:hypothetical protein
MTSPANLKPDDPTPDPDAKAEDPVDVVAGDTTTDPAKGTTFVDTAVQAAMVAAGEVDTSDGVDGEEVVDAALKAAKEVVPLGHHTITELRKLLVPIVTAIVTALAAGGFAEWRAGTAKDEAVQEAEANADLKIKASEERARELEVIRAEIRKALIKDASWDDVGTLQVNEAEVIKALDAALTEPMAQRVLKHYELKGLVEGQIQELQAQSAIPSRPAAGH